ncbi:hypothetical protein HQ545_07485 [Candidatus Woesearchaeota archaeon]|nr:hypothetical protein [Candidatus Woesearchaeota archaeon]
MRYTKIFVMFILLIFLLPTVLAIDQVVINSKDWRDVYTGMMYAKYMDLDVHYVAEETHGLMLITSVLNKNNPDVLLIENSKNFFIAGYESNLKSAGFNVEKYASQDPKDTNLEFAKIAVDSGNLKSFIIVDSALGYNAMSVASYSVLTYSFVIFADNTNIDEVYDFIQDNQRPVILYGKVDREVKSRLNDFNPRVIDEGDKYSNNIEIVKLFIKESPVRQVIFTHGEVIEPGLFSDDFPVLFIGVSNVPDQVIDYIHTSDITTGVVVGYELFDNAKRIREETGIKVYLKFGQGRNSEMQALDIFELPKYLPNIQIKTVRYNTVTQQLEVVYENKGDFFAYVQALSHDLQVNNETIQVVGDEEAFFMSRGDVLAMTYDIDLLDYLDETILVKSKVTLGESPKSMTKLLSWNGILEVVSVEDNSVANMESLVFNPKKQVFELVIINPGIEKAIYVDPEIVDLVVAGSTNFYGGSQQRIAPGAKMKFEIPAPMEPEDYSDNPGINVRVRYGSRADGLVKSLTQEFELVLKTDYAVVVAVSVVVLVIILLFLIWRKKRPTRHRRARHPAHRSRQRYR